MKLSIALLTVGTLSTVSAFAQEVPPDARRPGQVASFDALSDVLEPNAQIIGRDNTGRSVRGRLSSLSGDRLVVVRRRWFRSVEEEFGGDAVRRVHIADSEWQGMLLGGAVGFLGPMAVLDDDSGCDLCPVLLAPLGAAVGGLIDWLLNRVVYIS